MNEEENESANRETVLMGRINRLSVIVSVYNEEDVLDLFYQTGNKLRKRSSQREGNTEVIIHGKDGKIRNPNTYNRKDDPRKRMIKVNFFLLLSF